MIDEIVQLESLIDNYRDIQSYEDAINWSRRFEDTRTRIESRLNEIESLKRDAEHELKYMQPSIESIITKVEDVINDLVRYDNAAMLRAALYDASEAVKKLSEDPNSVSEVSIEHIISDIETMRDGMNLSYDLNKSIDSIVASLEKIENHLARYHSIMSDVGEYNENVIDHINNLLHEASEINEELTTKLINERKAMEQIRRIINSFDYEPISRELREIREIIS